MVKQLSTGKTTSSQPFAQWQTQFGHADGILHITLTRNNTLLTLTNPIGDVLTWTSCRNCGFTDSQKSTEIATVTTAEEMGNRIRNLKLKKVCLIFHGGSRFRRAVLRGFRRSQCPISWLMIKSNTPYNGCRLKKKRRT
jgi:small subunit ribosomal protein S11